jgi:hypothetical protein
VGSGMCVCVCVCVFVCAREGGEGVSWVCKFFCVFSLSVYSGMLHTHTHTQTERDKVF